jgi:hypothetical protein
VNSAPAVVAPPEEPTSAAHARLGSEALARLRGRYADVLAGLSRRVADEQRREQLREQADRLNPDNWVTDDEVTAGLEDYETVLASLRDVVGRRRRRKRGRGADSGQAGSEEGQEEPGATRDEGPDEDDTAEADTASADPLPEE